MSGEEPLVNNGEHLYYKNMAHKILRQSKIEETKKNDEDNFTAEFNFKPHFLKTETDNYSNVKSRFYRESIPVYKYTDENTTFQPNKNTKTFELKTEEDIKKMTNRLHSEQKKFLENKEKLSKNQIKEECPFMPTINVPGKADPKYFMMRLQKWSKTIEDKNKENLERKKNMGNIIDEKKKMFHPVVKDPIAKKIKRDKEVHIDLYDKGLEHIDYRKSIMTTDTREDLAKIDSEKKEKIKTLKEERDRYKKEKKEKMEKEINERTLKAKAEKENLDKIIAEKTDIIMNRMENKELARIKEQEMKEKKLKKNQKKEIKTRDKKLKNEINDKSKIKPKTAGKSAPKVSKKIEKEKSKEKIPLSSKQRTNTKTSKLETKKEKEIKGVKTEKINLQKDDKKERNKSQPPKDKKKESVAKKSKEAKTIAVNKTEKIEKKDSYAKKVKNAKNNIKNLLHNKTEEIKELEFNNSKNNKKGNNSRIVKTEINVVSIGTKAGKIKKDKKVKK